MKEGEENYYYCAKCGWHDIIPRDECPFCDTELEILSLNIKNFLDLSKEEQKKVESRVIEVIEKNPSFDPKLRAKRLEETRRYNEESMKRMYSNKVEVTCPYCHSKNTRRISAGSRMVSANLFGLGSPNLGKQWHCRNCGSDF